jgi:t-SNARE complex subunit (syntaxin)
LAYTLEIQKDVDNLVDAQTELFSVAEQRTHHISTIVGAGTREIAIVSAFTFGRSWRNPKIMNWIIIVCFVFAFHF